jgi:tRNA (mo5U34)-methyltransferase
VLQTLTMPEEAQRLPTPRDLPFGARRTLAHAGWPKMAFIEQGFAGDPTNWWAPNDACVEAMLHSSGLVVVGRPGYQLWVCTASGLPPPVRDELERATGCVPLGDRFELAAESRPLGRSMG